MIQERSTNFDNRYGQTIGKEAIKAELNDPEKSGYLLGYPKCCIERWAKLNLTQYWTLYLLENLNDVYVFHYLIIDW